MKLDHELQFVVSITYGDFKSFSYFDTFCRLKRYRRPLAFFVLVSIFSGICFYLSASRSDALLPAIVLAAIAVLLPAGYFLSFALSVRDQKNKLQLSATRAKEAYTLRFTPDAFFAAAGTGRPIRVPWKNLYHAYRTQGSIYIYATQTQAFLVPPQELSGAVWDYIINSVSPAQYTDR